MPHREELRYAKGWPTILDPESFEPQYRSIRPTGSVVPSGTGLIWVCSGDQDCNPISATKSLPPVHLPGSFRHYKTDIQSIWSDMEAMCAHSTMTKITEMETPPHSSPRLSIPASEATVDVRVIDT